MDVQDTTQQKLSTFFDKLFADQGTSNLVVSPLSVYSCLAMVAEGSSGQSFNELAEAFGYQSEAQVYHPKMQASLEDLHSQQSESVKVKMSNMLFTNKDIPLNDSFRDAVVANHWATAENADFNDPTTKDQINKRISDATEGCIKNPIDSIPVETLCMLINTIYFKGTWVDQFSKDSTYPQTFYLKDNSEVEVDFMHQTMQARLHETDSASYMALGYKGNRFSFVVELVKNRTLKATNGEAVLATTKAESKETNVDLPKFKINFKIELLDMLKTLGIRGVINGEGLEKISPKDIALSQVIHQAFIQVDEEGTEAAASTMGLIGITCIQEPVVPAEFRADSPFFFHIVDTQHDTILFSGAVQKPEFN